MWISQIQVNLFTEKGLVQIYKTNFNGFQGCYSKITLENLEKIFRPDDKETKIPLIDERLRCLQEVGEVLLDKYDGNFESVVKNCGNSAENLLKTIVQDFPCFRDEAEYNGQRVSIYKRAQILVGDIWAFYKGEGLGYFKDINESISMFADYRVPQVLIHFKALEYTDELMEDLKNGRFCIDLEIGALSN